MNPIEIPGPGAPPEQVIAFLSHQLQAMTAHVIGKDETETQICQRLQTQMDSQVAGIKADCDAKIERFENDARRYGILRASRVQCRKLGVSAKGIELDAALDKAWREGQH